MQQVEASHAAKISAAFVAIQRDIAPVLKDKQGVNNNYADRAQVLKVIQTACHPHDCGFLQLMGEIVDGKLCIENVLLHSSGEYISKESWCYIDDEVLSSRGKPLMSKSQRVGVAGTYWARKSALAFFGIGEKDERDADDRHTLDEYHSHQSPQIVESTAVETLEHLISMSSNPMRTIEAIVTKENVSNIRALSEEAVIRWVIILERKLAGNDNG